ncbi:MAG: 2-oxoacid:acceptor oxidoreductase family protein [Planctomycetes bacterium]|nr:2-oxoacid:acceptor oxidoreductase family protein [Planctomycetota bacterium]
MQNQKIVICGLGGQGILFMARILYEMARLSGKEVLGSETHGMSQRGGSVTSHIKIGDFHSPMVRKGTADLLLVAKAQELYANLPFLGPGGRIAMNASVDFSILPGVNDAMMKKNINCQRVDATGKAVEIGVPLSANLVLLSYAVRSGLLCAEPDLLLQAVKKVSPPRFIDSNMSAVNIGMIG